MKKIITIAIICLVCVVAVCGFAACSGETEEAKYSVVCTVFPAYDWARNVIGDSKDVQLILLLDSGADLHNYNPTTRDMLNISKCDLFVYVGGESDEWVDDVLSSYPSEKRVNLNLIKALGERAREEEELEGAEEEHEEHDHEETEYDEHIWLSLKNAVVCTNAIAEKIAAFDPENGETYKQNAAAYINQLNDLDASFISATKDASVKTLVFCDRFPFLYMMKDYGLNYFAAFSGCSTETQASVETMRFLKDKVVEYDLKYVIVLEGSDKKVASAVLSEAKGERSILVLDSLQSVGKTEVENGTTYLAVMQKNLDVLTRAVS